MIVEEIAIHNCSKGDILACDVFNPYGITLAAKDTQLNEYIIEKLIALGIERIRIYKNTAVLNDRDASYREFKLRYFDTILKTKRALHDLATGKSIDLSEICSIAYQIQRNISGNDHIIRCLSEVRSADEYTYTHSVNVSLYSMLIAKWLKLSEFEMNKAVQSGLLHDVGKSRIPVEILNKRGILTKEEFELIKSHTVLGYEIVKGIENIDHDIKETVLLHHERMDGSGYPLNFSPDSINLFSRIVAVADVFDAMTSERVYKKRSTPFEAFEMFQTTGLSMFDTKIINLFIKNLSVYLVGLTARLDDGQTGEIVYVPLHDPACPIIKTASGYLDFSVERFKKISCIL